MPYVRSMSNTSEIRPRSMRAQRRVVVWLMIVIFMTTLGVVWSVRESPFVEPTPVVLPGGG